MGHSVGELNFSSISAGRRCSPGSRRFSPAFLLVVWLGESTFVFFLIFIKSHAISRGARKWGVLGIGARNLWCSESGTTDCDPFSEKNASQWPILLNTAAATTFAVLNLYSRSPFAEWTVFLYASKELHYM